MPRVVLITNDSPQGQRVLQAVFQRGIVLDAVLYLTGSLGLPPARGGAGLARRLLRWPGSAGRTARRMIRFRARRRGKYAERCARVIGTGAMNGPRLLRDLRALAPDWIILGGGGILGPEVIATARLGVLNAHPALLPWIRGCGVVGASLEHAVALGATLHRVDAGIDTGAVIERRLLAVAPGDARLGSLERRCDDLAAEMMADAVEAIVRRGQGLEGGAQAVRYPLFRWPDAAGRQRRQDLAAAGRAQSLYDAWRPLCPGEGARLPADVQPPPPFSLRPLTGAENAAGTPV